MATQLFDLPIELRSSIFESLSLRDISRLRQTCSLTKHKLEDLSFLKVLDFSYSPDITVEAFSNLLHKRVNRATNNITKVVIAHTRNLNKLALEELFETLPRIKDIRIRHSLTSECINVLLKQENLELITYSTDAQSLVKKSEPVVVKCTKLTRFNVVEMMGEVPLYLETKLTLLKMNPALKTDVYFMKFVVQGLLNFTDMETNAAEVLMLLDLAIALNDFRVFAAFWHQSDNYVLALLNQNIEYAFRLISGTIKLVLAMSEERRSTDNEVFFVCYTLQDVTPLFSQDFPEFSQRFDPAEFAAIVELAAQYNDAKPRMDELEANFEKFKKRPFHRLARESYIHAHFRYLENLRGSPEFKEELNNIINKISPIMKRMPRRIRLLRASLYAQQSKFQEAYDEFLGIIDPRYVLKIQADLSDDKNAQAIFGAYHMAADYLADLPELLPKLEAVNTENYKMLVKHFAKLQPCYDKGTCTKTVTDITTGQFYKQYWYACYTCEMDGNFAGICYSCAEGEYHTGHQVAYLRVADCYCDCNKGPINF